MPTSWDQKRAQIAQALNSPQSGGPGWGGVLSSIGAGISANPSLRWGPQADVEMAGGAAASGGNQGLFGGLFGNEGLLGREGLFSGMWGGDADGSLGNQAPTPSSVNSMDEAARQRLLQAQGGLY